MAEHHREIGLALGPHSTAGNSLVVLFAAQIVPKDSKDAGEYTEVTESRTPEAGQTANPYTSKNWAKFAKDIFDFQNKVRKDPKIMIA